MGLPVNGAVPNRSKRHRLTGLTNGAPTIARFHHPPVAGIHLTDGLYSAAVYLTVRPLEVLRA